MKRQTVTWVIGTVLLYAVSVAVAAEPPVVSPASPNFIVYQATESNLPWMFRMNPPGDYDLGIVATWIEVHMPKYGLAYRLDQKTLLKVDAKRYEGMRLGVQLRGFRRHPGRMIAFNRLDELILTEAAATDILRKCRDAIRSEKEAANPGP